MADGLLQQGHVARDSEIYENYAWPGQTKSQVHTIVHSKCDDTDQFCNRAINIAANTTRPSAD